MLVEALFIKSAAKVNTFIFIANILKQNIDIVTKTMMLSAWTI